MQFFKNIFLVIILFILGVIHSNIFAQSNESELIYFQTDRAVYITGESIYYKLYILNDVTKRCSDLSKVAYIIIRPANSNTRLKFRVEINKGMSNGSIIIPDTLVSGVYQLVAFTGIMRNSGYERFFQKEITIVNRNDKAIDFKLTKTVLKDSNSVCGSTLGNKITTDKLIYKPREKVLANFGKVHFKGNVSVSVFEDSPVPYNYKSMVETLNDSSFFQIKKKIPYYYSPEKKAKLLRGFIIDRKTQLPVKNAVVLLSCVDTIPNLEYAVSNSNGIFQIMLSKYYNAKELFLTIKDMPDNQDWQIRVEDEVSGIDNWNPMLFSGSGIYKDYITKSQNLVYINKTYLLSEEDNDNNRTNDSVECSRFFHCPVTTIIPSDFTALPAFPELVVEILPQVRLINENGKYYAQIFIDFLREFDMRSPAIFLDGVYVDDINKILLLGSDQISKIDLITEERVFGDLIFGGLISIVSKKNEIVKSKPASHSLRLMNDDFNRGDNFYSFNPNTIRNKNTPFFRQLLYWNPDIRLIENKNINFEFYTSDNEARYLIKLEGISDDGQPISASHTIEVSEK